MPLWGSRPEHPDPSDPDGSSGRGPGTGGVEGRHEGKLYLSSIALACLREAFGEGTAKDRVEAGVPGIKISKRIEQINLIYLFNPCNLWLKAKADTELAVKTLHNWQ